MHKAKYGSALVRRTGEPATLLTGTFPARRRIFAELLNDWRASHFRGPITEGVDVYWQGSALELLREMGENERSRVAGVCDLTNADAVRMLQFLADDANSPVTSLVKDGFYVWQIPAPRSAYRRAGEPVSPPPEMSASLHIKAFSPRSAAFVKALEDWRASYFDAHPAVLHWEGTAYQLLKEMSSNECAVAAGIRDFSIDSVGHQLSFLRNKGWGVALGLVSGSLHLWRIYPHEPDSPRAVGPVDAEIRRTYKRMSGRTGEPDSPRTGTLSSGRTVDSASGYLGVPSLPQADVSAIRVSPAGSNRIPGIPIAPADLRPFAERTGMTLKEVDARARSCGFRAFDNPPRPPGLPLCPVHDYGEPETKRIASFLPCPAA